MSVPELSGLWDLFGTALGPDGSALYEWSAVATLTATTDAFALVLQTKGARASRSTSFAERLDALPDGRYRLRYGYEADAASHDFFGLAQLTFAADGKSASGSSCNYNGRYVVMEMTLTRP